MDRPLEFLSNFNQKWFPITELLWNSWIKLSLWNEPVKRISLNECILIMGHCFYTNRMKSDILTYIEKVMPRPTHKVKLSGYNLDLIGIRWPYLTRLMFLLSRLEYIYSIEQIPVIVLLFLNWKRVVEYLKIFKNIFFGPMPLFLLPTHKQCILSQRNI
jgi:hypothetical protein